MGASTVIIPKNEFSMPLYLFETLNTHMVEAKVEDSTFLPIGRPYDNSGILLLNEDNTETAGGEIGEICVKGPVLTLGYYSDMERTNEAFIQNPLNPNYRELIYKTGDLGLFREDGNLEFHGRKGRPSSI